DVRPLELSREISAVQFSKELFQIEMPALGTVVARENAAESHTVHAAARAAGARVFGIGRDERGGRFAAVDAGEQQRRRGLQHGRSEEHTSELQSRGHLVCRLLLEKKKEKISQP